MEDSSIQQGSSVAVAYNEKMAGSCTWTTCLLAVEGLLQWWLRTAGMLSKAM